MPVIKHINKKDQLVDMYVVPFGVRTTEITNIDVLKEHRKEYGQQIEFLTGLQKSFQSEKDYESAKKLKETITHFQAANKAVGIAIDYFEKLDTTDTKTYPVDLTTYLDYEFNSLEEPI